MKSPKPEYRRSNPIATRQTTKIPYEMVKRGGSTMKHLIPIDPASKYISGF